MWTQISLILRCTETLPVNRLTIRFWVQSHVQAFRWACPPHPKDTDRLRVQPDIQASGWAHPCLPFPWGHRQTTDPMSWARASWSSWTRRVSPQFSRDSFSSNLKSTSAPMPTVKMQTRPRAASRVLLRILRVWVSPTVGFPSVRKTTRDTLRSSMSLWAT